MNDFTEHSTKITDRLRLMDQQRVGSDHHAYRFNTPLTQQQVDLFEVVHELSIPISYRRFLTELGNGGAGPFYGVLPLHSKLTELLQPFPYTGAVTLPKDDEDVWDKPIPGAVTIADYGCGTYFLLVVKGESAGQVWVDNRYKYGELSMIIDEEKLEVEGDLAIYEGKPFNGIAILFAENGAKLREVTFVNGLQHGENCQWYPNGQVMHKWHSVNGSINGKSTEWHDNGFVRCSAIYVYGIEMEYDEWDKAGKHVLKRTLDPGSELAKYSKILTAKMQPVRD